MPYSNTPAQGSLTRMGLLFAAGAAVFFVILDVLRKILGTRLRATDIVIAINSGTGVVFLALLATTGLPDWDSTFVLIVLLEAFTFAASSVLYVQAVSLSPLSLTIPYLALTPVFSAIMAALLIGEVPSTRGGIGILLTVVGAVALHFDRRLGPAGFLTAPFREPGSWRMLVVAATWGFTVSLDKIAISHGSEILLGFGLSSLSATLLLVARRLGLARWDPVLGALPRGGTRGSPLLFLAILVSGFAVLCQYFAYRYLLVAYVETIKRAGGLLSAAIGIVVFHEERASARIPAACLMVLGLILILL